MKQTLELHGQAAWLTSGGEEIERLSIVGIGVIEMLNALNLRMILMITSFLHDLLVSIHLVGSIRKDSWSKF